MEEERNKEVVSQEKLRKFRLSLESSMVNTLRVRQKDSLVRRLSAMRTFLESNILDQIDLEGIGEFEETSRALVFFVDVLVNGEIHFCDIEYISHSIKVALQTLSLPKISIFKNSLEDKLVFEVEPKESQPFLEKCIGIPEVYSVGVVNGKLVLDLTELELASCDTVFLVVIDENEESKTNLIEKLRRPSE